MQRDLRRMLIMEITHTKSIESIQKSASSAVLQILPSLRPEKSGCHSTPNPKSHNRKALKTLLQETRRMIVENRRVLAENRRFIEEPHQPEHLGASRTAHAVLPISSKRTRPATHRGRTTA